MFIKTCRDRMRTLLGALMIGALALTSGCFSGDVNVVINEDGSADLKTTLVSVPMLAEIVEQSKAATTAKNPDAQVTPVTKENMSGYEITEHYATIEKLSENDFFKANEGKNTGITVNKSLFYTDYNFDLLFEGSQNGGGAGAFASNITFTYQMNLPVAPTSSNADRSENDGKQLTWNLGKTLVTGRSRLHSVSGTRRRSSVRLSSSSSSSAQAHSSSSASASPRRSSRCSRIHQSTSHRMIRTK